MRRSFSFLSLFCLLIISLCFAKSDLYAAYIIKDGKFIDTKYIATLPVEEHYNLGVEAIKEKNWPEAVHQFRVVTINFPLSSWAKEALYFLGISYYHVGDKEMANNNFSEYLKENQNPKYFEETFRYKLAIADAFANGAKRHILGYEKLPQWLGAEELAITIYDEIISSLPNHELAAKALFAKAACLTVEERFKESIEAYQTLIRKFPKTELAAKSYVSIADVYAKQACQDVHNPDILPLAEINIKRFTQDFPRDPHIEPARQSLVDMKETFAKALYETGLFYERKSEPKAAVLYYHSALLQFPDTATAKQCKERLNDLQVYAQEINISF